MNQTARIATWNLERPKINGTLKNERCREQLARINADLWVLTETSSAISPGPGYAALSSKPWQNYDGSGYHEPGECFTTIWSRWPLRQEIETFDPALAMCAEVDSPFGPMIVYGTIITWAGDRGKDGKAPYWSEHLDAIRMHAADWSRLKKLFPKHVFCAAGDFNQARDGSKRYGGWEVIQALTKTLDDLSWSCVTEQDMVATGLLRKRHSVDHICLSSDIVPCVAAIGAWEGTNPEGKRLSDHNGVWVDLRVA